GDAGNALQQHVPARQEADQHLLQDFLLSLDRLGRLPGHGILQLRDSRGCALSHWLSAFCMVPLGSLGRCGPSPRSRLTGDLAPQPGELAGNRESVLGPRMVPVAGEALGTVEESAKPLRVHAARAGGGYHDAWLGIARQAERKSNLVKKLAPHLRR